jgi:hypothetical protein
LGSSKPVKKPEIYQILHQLNAAFTDASLLCQRLKQIEMFDSKASRLFPSLIQELQSEINSEFLGPLLSSENADWSRYKRHGPDRSLQLVATKGHLSQDNLTPMTLDALTGGILLEFAEASFQNQ